MLNRIKRFIYKLKEKKELKETFLSELNRQTHYDGFHEDTFVCPVPNHTIHTDEEIKNYYDKLFDRYRKYR